MRNKLLVLLSVLVTLSLLVACATAQPQVVEKVVKETVVVEKEVVETVMVEKETVVTATPEPEKPKEPVHIVYWTDPLFDPSTASGHPELTTAMEYEQMVVDDYIKDNPHVTVEIQVLDWNDLPKKVPAAVAAGVPPDILRDYLGRSSAYGYEGVTVNLEEVLPAEELADFLPSLIEQYTIDGHLHALPIFYWAQNMIVNVGPFEQAGLVDMLPLDDHDWTFEEFEAASKAIKEAGVGVEYPFVTQVASEQADYNVHSFMWAACGKTWRDDCTGLAFDDPKSVAGLEFLNKLYQEGYINPDATTAGYQDVDNLFYSGKGVFIGGGIVTISASVPQAEREGKVAGPMDAQMMRYPHAEGEEPAGLPVGPTGLVLFDREDRSEYELQEISRFLLHLASEKWQRDYAISTGQFPTRLSVGTPLAGDPNYEMTLNWVKQSGAANMGLQCPNYAEVRVGLPAFLQAMFLGQMTPQEAADAMMELSADIFAQ